jgi:uncharacterized protein with HEPN domain
MLPETRALLEDMLEAGRSITRFVSGKGWNDFRDDEILRSGVYYQFVIIGEALSQLRKRDADTVDRISEADRIVGFRNQIIHGYGKIDDEITWRVVEQKLPILISDLENLLA